MQIEQLTKINNELNKFISTTTKQIRELNTQLDGKIETGVDELWTTLNY